MKLNKSMLNFLTELEMHNEKDRMDENRERYQTERRTFIEFVKQLRDRLADIDSRVAEVPPKSTLYRINRDIRFSKNKTPYNPWFSSIIADGGRRSESPGYFVRISPGNKSFIAGGIYEIGRERADRIRDKIVAQPDRWSKIVKKIKKSSREWIDGEQYVRVPSGYDRDHEHADWLRNKSWHTYYEWIDDSLVLSDGFMDWLMEKYDELGMFHDFLY